MSFTPNWTPVAERAFNELRAAAEQAAVSRAGAKRTKASKQEGLFKQVAKAIGFLLNDPKHPGLQTHEYSSIPHPFEPNGKVFEAYAQDKTPGAYRIFWCYGPGQGVITIIAITPHP